MSFVHLHVHTEYSLLDGMSTVKELFDRAEELGMPGLAITDHGTMMGVMDFMQEAGRHPSVKPVVGCEIYLTRHYDHTLHDAQHKKYFHLVLLAKNLVGYHNLCRIASIAGTEGLYFRPRIDHDTLKKYSEGLVCLSACIGGEVPQAILDEDFEGAEKAVEWYKSVFGEDFYLEVCWHRNNREGGPRDVAKWQKFACDKIFELAREHGVKVVATNDSHFTLKHQERAHDTMLAINCEKKISDTDRLRYTGEEYLKDEQEMLSLFPDHPEVISNTLEVLGKIERFGLEGEFSVPVPKRFRDEKDLFSTLAKLAREGFGLRYGDGNAEAERRLDWELDKVKEGHFENYFLCLYDIMRYADSQNIWFAPGRGSSPSSILCYCLGITKVDPVEFGLQSERFWRLGKVLSRPDVDLDFEPDSRMRIIAYLKEQYGENSVSEVITLGVFSARTTIKSVLKAYGIPPADISRVMSSVQSYPIHVRRGGESYDVKPTLENHLKYCRRFILMMSRNEIYEKALKDALELEGRKNSTGIHACAVIVSDKALSETVPVMKKVNYGQKNPVLVTQYDGHYVEMPGLLKFDFLELHHLDVIKATAAETGIDPREIPFNDKCAFAQFRKENTDGIFLFESSTLNKACRLVMPDRLSEIFDLHALLRPGPMDNLPDYAKYKFHSGERPSRGETVDRILDDTYGIVVYQEQVNEILHQVGGFSLEEAEDIRRLMAKRRKDDLEEARCRFLVNGMNNGIHRDEMVKLWDFTYDSALYAFMKAHAVGYGMISYMSAYLKTYALRANGNNLENIYMKIYRSFSVRP